VLEWLMVREESMGLLDQSLGAASRQFNVGPRFLADFETEALLLAVLD
jgi:hypothetical protein